MLGSEEGNSITLPSPPQYSPNHEFQASGHLSKYLRSSTSSPFANLRDLSDKGETLLPPLEVSCKTSVPVIFFIYRVFRPTDRSNQVGPGSFKANLQLLSLISIISPFLRAVSLMN